MRRDTKVGAYCKRSCKIERHIPRGIIWEVQRFWSAMSQIKQEGGVRTADLRVGWFICSVASLSVSARSWKVFRKELKHAVTSTRKISCLTVNIRTSQYTLSPWGRKYLGIRYRDSTIISTRG